MSGPLTVPAARTAVVLCLGCEHHRALRAVFAQVAEGTTREWVCAHPEAWPATQDSRIAAIRGHQVKNDGGRYIGKSDTRPEWCPLGRKC